MSSPGDYSDRAILLRSNSLGSDDDLEHGAAALSQSPNASRISSGSGSGGSSSNKGGLASDLLKRLDRGLTGSGRRLSVHQRLSSSSSPSSPSPSDHPNADADDMLGDGAPPEWALLLIGCLLGVATGLCVASFNRGVSSSSNFEGSLIGFCCLLYSNVEFIVLASLHLLLEMMAAIGGLVDYISWVVLFSCLIAS